MSMPPKIQYEKVGKVVAQAARASELAESLRKQAKELIGEAVEAERFADRLGLVVRLLLDGEDMDVSGEDFGTNAVSALEFAWAEHETEEVDESTPVVPPFVKVDVGRAPTLTEAKDMVERLKAMRPKPAESEEQSKDETVGETEEIAPPVTMPEIVVTEMTEAECLTVIPAGNDLPRPELPLSLHEAAELHKPYLDMVDGPYCTRSQLERFEVERRVDAVREMTHWYRCVMCADDASLHPSYECLRFAGGVVCRSHGGQIAQYLFASGARGVRMEKGERKLGRPYSMYLGAAFKLADEKFKADAVADATMLEANLKREAEIIARMRAPEAPEPSVEPAQILGTVKVDLSNWRPEGGAAADEDVLTGDDLLIFGNEDEPQSSSRDSGAVEIVEGVTVSLASDVADVPVVSHEELDAAKDEESFIALMRPLWALRNRLKDALGDVAILKRDPRYIRLTSELTRIHNTWDVRDRASHQLWQKKMNLHGLLGAQEEHRRQDKERVAKGFPSLPFPRAAELVEAMKDRAVLAAVQEMDRNWKSRQQTEAGEVTDDNRIGELKAQVKALSALTVKLQSELEKLEGETGDVSNADRIGELKTKLAEVSGQTAGLQSELDKLEKERARQLDKAQKKAQKAAERLARQRERGKESAGRKSAKGQTAAKGKKK